MFETPWKVYSIRHRMIILWRSSPCSRDSVIENQHLQQFPGSSFSLTQQLTYPLRTSRFSRAILVISVVSQTTVVWVPLNAFFTVLTTNRATSESSSTFRVRKHFLVLTLSDCFHSSYYVGEKNASLSVRMQC